MTKNQFKALAKEKGIVECNYSGNKKTMFLKGTNVELTKEIMEIAELLNLEFKVSDAAIS